MYQLVLSCLSSLYLLRIMFDGPMATGRIELDVEERKLLEGCSRAQRLHRKSRSS
jgi:hypothetical protein